jgi:transcriptional regulator with XRE-family HTH domain
MSSKDKQQDFSKLHLRIRHVRKKLGLTYIGLARKMHVRPRTCYRWTAGDTVPTNNQLVRLARWADVDPLWMLMGPKPASERGKRQTA